MEGQGQFGQGGPGGRRAWFLQRLAAQRRGGQGGGFGQGGAGFGQGGFGQGGGGFGQGGGFAQGGGFRQGMAGGQGGGGLGRLAQFLQMRQQQGQGPGAGGFGGGRGAFGGGDPFGGAMGQAGADPGSQREMLVQRAARLEKLLQTTYAQIEKLDADAAGAQGPVMDVSAEDVVESVPDEDPGAQGQARTP